MYKRVRKLVSSNQIKKDFPVKNPTKKTTFDESIIDIFNGNGKFLLIVGPCSADNIDAVFSYCEKLKVIAENVKDKIFIVPRIYTTKPRTEAGAYRGILHTPFGQDDFSNGIIAARKLLASVANEFDFFAADEMLYPELYDYFDDVLSYVTIGARTSENQQHKMVASAIDTCVGIKNPMHGNLKSLAQAVKTVATPNNFVYNGFEVVSSGNKSAHAILRGYTDNSGKMIPNYSLNDIDEYIGCCNELNIGPNLIVDCNHFNSGKDYLKEEIVAKQVVSLSKKEIKGLMIESYLLDGRQDRATSFGMSLTDACLGIEKTERLIYELAQML